MRKVRNTIPVFDICSIDSTNQLNEEIIAEPFGQYLDAHPNLHVAHRHSFFHIVLFTLGEGSHSIDFQKFSVAPRQIYFMKPGQVHNWNFQGEIDGYVINFSDHIFSNFLVSGHYLDQFTFLQGVADECVINLDPHTYEQVKATIQNIVTEVLNSRMLGSDLIRAYLIALFIITQRSVSQHLSITNKPQNQVLLQNFRKLVDANFWVKRLPKEYAAILYITPNHLNALCKDLLGKSAGEVIRDRILLEAKRLLINADFSITEIASRLDFTDNSHFTRFFKKYTLVTPEKFRRDSSINHK